MVDTTGVAAARLDGVEQLAQVLAHDIAPDQPSTVILGHQRLQVRRAHLDLQAVGLEQPRVAVPSPGRLLGLCLLHLLRAGHGQLIKLTASSFYKEHPEQWTAMSQLLNAAPGPNSRGIRLGYFPRVRDAIESELVLVFEGRKTADEGLDAAVVRGSAILRTFSVINGAAGQGEI